MSMNKLIVGCSGHRVINSVKTTYNWNNTCYDWNNTYTINSYNNIFNNLYEWLYTNKDNINYCISGMAPGWDMLVASCVLDLGIDLHCYLPFKDTGKNWRANTKKHLNNLLNQASSIKYYANNYFDKVFLGRDSNLVNEANIILFYLCPNINEGGTYYTYNYAKAIDRQIINFY